MLHTNKSLSKLTRQVFASRQSKILKILVEINCITSFLSALPTPAEALSIILRGNGEERISNDKKEKIVPIKITCILNFIKYIFFVFSKNVHL
jgi:hypothetical protein